ncbi:MAG: DNA primase, partial [Oscillospiraceae bacterium]|nr:DNA primase [Oscillospiraceae bacterium]
MAFPENFITELAERNDIVDVVSSYVRLGKKSGSNLFGLCPFHGEKTPSFSVSADKQIYHCFGCGKGGGVINFVMEIENLSFPEAVEFLAKRAGMAIPEQAADKDAKRRSRLLDANRDAARFFHQQLGTEAGKAAVDYMQRRRISPKVARNFGLGYAPDTWDSLLHALRDKGYTDYELLDAGLVKRGKNGGFYDMFRNRLMFPVIDVRGNVIGFSGRILGDGEPKYLNTPETLVFNKSRNLFALNLAKKSKSGYIILSEGNIDVVSLHQAGFDSAVASLGTSLTPEQARMISRYANEVIIAYDSDNAGMKAAQRAISILEKLDLKVKVLKMQDAKDPDEYIKLKGPDAFRNLIEASEHQIDYRLGQITAKYDLSSDEQKVEFLKEASELVAKFPGSVERQVYAMRVAQMANVDARIVQDEVERRRKKLHSQARRTLNRENARPEQ